MAIWISSCITQTYISNEYTFLQDDVVRERAQKFSGEFKITNPDAVAHVLRAENQKRVASAAWWGFNKDDSTRALQQAIYSGASTIVIPNMGSPWIVEPLILVSDQTLLFEDGVILQAKQGSFHGRTDALFLFREIKNVTLVGYGAKIFMWKDDYLSSAYAASEERHAFSILSSQEITIEGFIIDGSGGDGIYVGVTSYDTADINEDITIRRVLLTNHQRRAINVVHARNLLIEDSQLLNTRGHFPQSQAGIHFEPGTPESKIVNCTLRRNYISGNYGAGVLISLQHLQRDSYPISVTLDKNIIENNGLGALYILRLNPYVSGSVILKGNLVRGVEFALPNRYFSVVRE